MFFGNVFIHFVLLLSINVQKYENYEIHTCEITLLLSLRPVGDNCRQSKKKNTTTFFFIFIQFIFVPQIIFTKFHAFPAILKPLEYNGLNSLLHMCFVIGTVLQETIYSLISISNVQRVKEIERRNGRCFCTKYNTQQITQLCTILTQSIPLRSESKSNTRLLFPEEALYKKIYKTSVMAGIYYWLKRTSWEKFGFEIQAFGEKHIGFLHVKNFI